MKPDYGMMLMKSGYAGVKQHFYAVPVTHLSVCTPGLFTFVVNRLHDGVEYALSFDFKSAQVADLLRKAQGRMGKFAAKLEQVSLGDTIEFKTPIIANIEATLGAIRRSDKEEFVPFIVSRVE